MENSLSIDDYKVVIDELNMAVRFTPPLSKKGSKRDLINTLKEASLHMWYVQDKAYLSDLTNWALKCIGASGWAFADEKEIPYPFKDSKFSKYVSHRRDNSSPLNPFEPYYDEKSIFVDYALRYPNKDFTALMKTIEEEGYLLDRQPLKGMYKTIALVRKWLKIYSESS